MGLSAIFWPQFRRQNLHQQIAYSMRGPNFMARIIFISRLNASSVPIWRNSTLKIPNFLSLLRTHKHSPHQMSVSDIVRLPEVYMSFGDSLFSGLRQSLHWCLALRDLKALFVLPGPQERLKEDGSYRHPHRHSFSLLSPLQAYLCLAKPPLLSSLQ